MIKKISIYGFCFNWVVAFCGELPQTKFDEFVKENTKDVSVEIGKIVETRDREGDIEIPKKIIINDKSAWEKFKKISEQCGAIIDTKTLKKEETNITAEENVEAFERFSRPASAAELESLGEPRVDLRVIDFGSIVNGIDPAQKEQCLKLMADDEALLKAIKDEVTNPYLLNSYMIVDVEALDGNKNKILLDLDERILEQAKKLLEDTLKKMAEYERSRETLVLTLVLLKDLHISLTTSTPFCCGSYIYFRFYKNELANVQALYHELNHALHSHLGIKPYYFQNIGGFNTRFEEGLFRFSGMLEKMLNEDKVNPSIQVPRGIVAFLDHEHGASLKDCSIMEVPAKKLYKIAQIALPWDGLEELWNIIGFANIGNCIYINRMSDLNLVKIPGLFHQRERHQYKSFTDFSEKPDGDIKQFLVERVAFLETLEDCVKSENIERICPLPKAWKTWLKLQNRSDAEPYGYFTMVDKTVEKLVETESETMELVGFLAPLPKLR